MKESLATTLYIDFRSNFHCLLLIVSRFSPQEFSELKFELFQTQQVRNLAKNELVESEKVHKNIVGSDFTQYDFFYFQYLTLLLISNS